MPSAPADSSAVRQVVTIEPTPHRRERLGSVGTMAGTGEVMVVPMQGCAGDLLSPPRSHAAPEPDNERSGT
ncbi:hypothetical protein GCM10009554_71790 [Kribbella koreensis]|uniref:Uncharacterized protein n=2 Tax=Kribbella TaxID=182639 RepID=A0ABP6YSY3_9ACTN